MTDNNLSPVAEAGTDSLLDALVALTRIHQRPFSGESLIAGLPLEDGRLTPGLFVRAAERAGFAARYVERSLGDIPAEVLPVALMRTDGTTVLLREYSPTSCVVSTPRDIESSIDIATEDLEAGYEGHCFFFRPSLDRDTEDNATEDHWFWGTIRRSRGIYAEVLVASLLINLFALVTPLFIMNVYDRVVPNYATETLWVLASGVVIVFVFDLVMRSLRGYFIDVAGKRADILLSARTFARVLDIRMKDRPARVGSFANNLQEFDSFRDFFTSTTMIAVIDLPFVLLFILLIYGIGGGYVAAVPLIAIPLVIGVSLLLQRPLQATVQQTFAESARKHAMLIESLTGLEGLKGARAEGAIQRRWEDFNGRLAALGLRARVLSLGTVNFAHIVQQLATVGTVIAGVYMIMAAELTVGGLIACTILTGRALAPMGQVAGLLTRYHHSRAAYQSIDRLMGMPVERPEGKKFVHRGTLDGRLEFDNVSFSYPEQPTRALANVSFRVEPGEKIGIIGRMGSGKSTIGKLIMGFYEPAEGSILVSGTDIKQLDPVDLRRNLIYVPQDIVLMNGTVRENIVLGSPLADDDQVIAAAELAGLTDYVDRHPMGFDLPVGERGANLSGGQRQAIAIARAFLTDAPMVLLDEPTNFMDNTTEGQFRSRVSERLKDKTVLLVTHKTSLLSLVDRLIVMNAGEIVADGPRDEIIRALSGGRS